MSIAKVSFVVRPASSSSEMFRDTDILGAVIGQRMIDYHDRRRLTICLGDFFVLLPDIFREDVFFKEVTRYKRKKEKQRECFQTNRNQSLR
jgi:hypothetical protein